MIQYYAPDIAASLSLPEDEARHCIKVLRHRPGDIIEVIDGCGHRYNCRLLSENPKHADVEIIATEDVIPAWNTHITIAVAPTKNIDRMEWLVEKLTEIGVNRIVPLLCRHSERKDLKTERLNRIAVSAMKQSLKATLPIIEPLTPFPEFIASDDSAMRYIAYCDETIPRVSLAGTYKGAPSVTALIGPEGDFDPAEITRALETGYTPVTLGNNRLRTETAALVACDTFHIIDQMLKS